MSPAGSNSAPVAAIPVASAAAPTSSVAPLLLEQQIQTVQRELDAVREELELLRRRDDTMSGLMRRLDEELRLAARLQQDFLPKALPQVGPVRFHTLFRPAGYVSGDLYDVMRLDERNVGFYLADAVGHGVPAALLTMFVKHALQTKEISPGGNGYRLLDPSEALCRLNARLIDQNLSYSTFATALYGTINVDTLRLTVSRAGHPAPIVLRVDGTPEPLEPEGSLLGIFSDETYDSRSTQLHPGDRVFVYTDGVEVAFWGTAGIDTRRWHDELMGYRSLSAQQLLAEFADRLDRETGSLAPKDDLTIIVAEVEAAGR
jgi:serine phosphatase RsbU (regulator of sigma subunit)